MDETKISDIFAEEEDKEMSSPGNRTLSRDPRMLEDIIASYSRVFGTKSQPGK